MYQSYLMIFIADVRSIFDMYLKFLFNGMYFFWMMSQLSRLKKKKSAIHF